MQHCRFYCWTVFPLANISQSTAQLCKSRIGDCDLWNQKRGEGENHLVFCFWPSLSISVSLWVSLTIADDLWQSLLFLSIFDCHLPSQTIYVYLYLSLAISLYLWLSPTIYQWISQKCWVISDFISSLYMFDHLLLYLQLSSCHQPVHY